MGDFQDIKDVLLFFFDKLDNVLALERFSLEIFRWNKYINFTGYINIKDVAVKLFLDSLVLKPLVLGHVLLDIGSGAGFPGLVLALVIPAVIVILLDSKVKRIIFQKQMVRILGVNNVRFIYGRVEKRGITNRYSFDLVALKAFGRLEKSLFFARKYLRQGGRVLLLKGFDEVDFALELGLIVLTYELPYSVSNRVIIIYQDIN